MNFRAERACETATFAQGPASMVDLLADRGAEDDAMCAVCGGGDSNKEAGNEIVFCERCDVAVHQVCYGIDVVPAGAHQFLFSCMLYTTLTISCLARLAFSLEFIGLRLSQPEMSLMDSGHYREDPLHCFLTSCAYHIIASRVST